MCAKCASLFCRVELPPKKALPKCAALENNGANFLANAIRLATEPVVCYANANRHTHTQTQLGQ